MYYRPYYGHFLPTIWTKISNNIFILLHKTLTIRNDKNIGTGLEISVETSKLRRL
jgi:hypothetical protein